MIPTFLAVILPLSLSLSARGDDSPTPPTQPDRTATPTPEGTDQDGGDGGDGGAGDASTKSNSAAPGGPRELEIQGWSGVQTDNPAPIPLGAPGPGLVGIAVVQVADKAVIMSDGRRATLRMDPAQTRWTGSALTLEHQGGVRVYSSTEATWWQPSSQTVGPTLGELLTASGSTARWLEVETLRTGMSRVWANISGKRHRVGMFKGAPTATIYLLAPDHRTTGRDSIRLSKASGFTFDEQGNPVNTVPAQGQAVAVVTPPAATSQQWVTDLARLRGAEPTVTWATMLDLDRDEVAEGVFCVTGGKDDTHCYVADPDGETRRYFGLSSLRFDGGDPAKAPQIFTQRGGVYIMHADATSKRPVIWTARYDGDRYTVESVR